MMTVNSMHKLVTILFILLLLLVTPVYPGSSFQYSRPIQTDNLMGYKSVILDKNVYAHSNHLNDLRVINEKGEEVPYSIASVLDATTETEKSSFILSEEAQYSTSQDGTDSIITIQVSHLNAFRLELNTDNLTELTYGLFGVKDQSTYYLSEGDIFTHLPSDPTIKKDIEWTNNPPIDKLRLIIHRRDGEPINPKSITVKFYLNQLIFKDPGDSQFWLVYGNETLLSPIYETLNYKDILQSHIITPTGLGAEIKNPSNVGTSSTLTKYKFFSKSTLSALVFLFLLAVGFRLWKKNK